MREKNIDEVRYKTIVDLAPDVVYTISKTGKLTSLSSAFEKITGWKSSYWIGKNFAGIVHPLDLPRALINFQKTLGGQTLPYYNLRIRTKNKGYILGEFKSAPDISDGKIIGVIGIGRDITLEQKEQVQLRHYRDLVYSSDSAIISRDMDGVILTWNKAAEKLFGYKSREIIGKNFSILIPPEFKNELSNINKMVKKGKPIESYRAVRVRKNGEKIHIIAKISPIKDEKKNVVGASIFDRDNTKNKKEEESAIFLARASKILSSSLDYKTTLRKLARILVPEIADWSSVHIVDENSKLTQLTVAHIDPKMVKWAKTLQKKYEKEPAEDSNNATARVVRTGKAELYPYIDDKLIDKHVKKKDDKVLIKKLKLRSLIIAPLVSGRKILGAITIVSTRDKFLYNEQDLKLAVELGKMAGQAVDNARLYFEAEREILKRKKIEDKLRESRDELSIILSSVVDGITVQDASGNLIYVNDAAAMSSGYGSAAEMVKKPRAWLDVFELISETGNPFPVENLPGRRVLAGDTSPSATIGYKNKITGEERWAIVRSSPVLDEKGQVKAVINIISDLTERKELERKKDDFISIASHELKTPITSIKGFIHLLRKEHLSYEESKSFRYIDRVDRQLEKLAELVEDLLDISRLEAGKLKYRLEKFNMGDLIKDVIGDMRTISDNYEISLSNGVSAKVYADKERISQVLINFINNAIKYSPNKNKVDVFVKKVEKDIIVGVKDYGIGIEDNEKDKIFDRFYRVKDMYDKTFPGLGVGLFISREIVEKHKGKIWVESKKGEGSTFYFSIPVLSDMTGQN